MDKCVEGDETHAGKLTIRDCRWCSLGATSLCVWTFSNKILEPSINPWATRSDFESMSLWQGLGVFSSLQGIWIMSHVWLGICGIHGYSSDSDADRNPLGFCQNVESDPAGLGVGGPLSLPFSQALRGCLCCPSVDHLEEKGMKGLSLFVPSM